MRPLILAIAAKIDQKEAAHMLKFLVSLGVRLIIASSTRSASVEIPLANTAKDVFDGRRATIASLREALKEITPSNSDFIQAFAIARVSNSKFGRYYLFIGDVCKAGK